MKSSYPIYTAFPLLFFLALPLPFLSPATASDFDDVLDSLGSVEQEQIIRGDQRALSVENFNIGIASTSIGTGNDGARGAVIQSDGKIVFAGPSPNGSDADFGVIRFLVDGSLDTSFSTTGKLILSFGSGAYDVCHSIKVDTSGRLLVAGKTDAGAPNHFNYAIARLTTSGTLDTSFNTTGTVITSVTDNGNAARAIAIQSDGKILVAGYAWLFGRYNYSVVRYLTNGSIDPSWVRSVYAESYTSGATGLTLDGEGRAVFSGSALNADFDFGIGRLGTNGGLDTSFMTMGLASFSITSAQIDAAYGVALNTLGDIIVAGATFNGSDLDFAVLRLRSDGQLDTSFKTTGKVIQSILSGEDKAFAISLQTDGKPILSGYTYNGANNDFSVVRLNSDGTLDTSFSTTGKANTAVGAAEDTAQAMAMSGDGYLIVAGRAFNGAVTAYVVARYQTDGTLAQSGKLDKSFGTNGTLMFNNTGGDAAYGIAIQTDKKMIFAGNSGSTDSSAFRLLPNGNLDTTFCTTGILNISNGVAFDQYTGVVIQTDGQYLVTGSYRIVSQDLFLTRFSTNGTFDTSFKTAGYANFNYNGNDYSTEILLLTDGSSVLGVTHNGGFLGGVRVRTNGTAEAAWMGTGLAMIADTTAHTYTAALQTNGKVVFGGTRTSDTAVARVNTNGSADTSFNTTGKWSMNIGGTDNLNSISVLPDGSIFGSGASGNDIEVIKLLSDGTLDTTFKTVGYALIDISGADVSETNIPQPNGKILVSGYSATDMVLMRLLSDGSFDTTFGTTGKVTTHISGTDRAWGMAIGPDGKICHSGFANSVDFGIACYWP